MIITHKMEIDLSKRRGLPALYVVQDDKYSRNLEITLVDNNAAWTPPQDAVVIVRYRKPDGTGGNYDTLPDGVTKAGSIAENVVTVALAPQVCTVPGKVHLAVCLVAGEKELNTFPCHVVVEPNPGLQCTSDNYYKVTGSLAASGWPANMYLGTDADGNVVTREAPEGGGATAGGGLDTLPDMVSWHAVRDGSTVTVDIGLDDGTTDKAVISLDDTDTPVKMVYNGQDIPMTWEGF